MLLNNLDLYSTGALVCELGRDGQRIEVLAWARNQLVARKAFKEICAMYPDRAFEVCQRAWVLGEKKPGKPPT